jgi:NAD(P)-dependent dehydrogenase (short-subunit alcohol dehydrogenase family)
MDLGLQGKTVLITGASKGIGEATAWSFAEEGAGHIHINSRTAESLEKVKQELQAKHNVAVTCHPIDIAARGNCQKLADAVGDVDILVNNAGAIPRGSIEMIDEDTWREAWDLKVFGFINMTRIYFARMKARKAGVIINDVGRAGVSPQFGYIAGSAGNAALNAFTHAMGGESMDHGVRVVAVNAGPVLTDKFKRGLLVQAKMKLGDESRWPELMAHMPEGRAATPREIADTIVFFASARSTYTNGCAITIDGGGMHKH